MADPSMHGVGRSSAPPPSHAEQGGYPAAGPSQNGAGSNVPPHLRRASAIARTTPGLDLSFGDTPMLFEKINLLGSCLRAEAISSLVLSVANVTYLDLRGNKLDANFGWNLIKAMKKRYLQLHYCNGVNVRAIRDNQITNLNLASFDGHNGMYGIEVTGAIFLAHFLRQNFSLTEFNFRRNDVEKDGAKALAQSMLMNPQCAVKVVNGMAPKIVNDVCRSGIDFSQFRGNAVRSVSLTKSLLDDDDFVFLEEWLRRYDCVTELDVSHNNFYKDGVRKLHRYAKDTKTLKKLNCSGLPVDLDGTALLVRAVAENETLEHVAISLGTCDATQGRQQVFQQLADALARHPTLRTFGGSGVPFKVFEVRNHEIAEFMHIKPPFSAATKAEQNVWLWLIAACRPGSLTKFQYGSQKSGALEYPEVTTSHVAFWPAVTSILRDVRSLLQVTLAVPQKYDTMVPAMQALATCQVLQSLNLQGYASATISDWDIPSEWTSIGPVPRWLIEERLRPRKPYWQAVHALVTALPHLEKFNRVELTKYHPETAERTFLLVCECIEWVGVTATENEAGGISVLNAQLSRQVDVELFFDVLRLLSRAPLRLDLNFCDPNVERVKHQQARLPAILTAGGDVPRLTQCAICLKNKFTSCDLLQNLDGNTTVRELTIDRIEVALPALFTAMCKRERPLQLEKLNIERKWMDSRKVRKRFNDTQRQQLDAIQAALVRSEVFKEVRSAANGVASRSSIEQMSAADFGEHMSGISLEDYPQQQLSEPSTYWRYFNGAKSYAKPPPGPDDEPVEELYLPLPLNEEFSGSTPLILISLVNCNLRGYIRTVIRQDEWPGSSRPLWLGPGRFRKAGEWDEGRPIEDMDEDEEPEYLRYHWRKDLRIGSSAARSEAAAATEGAPFEEDLLHQALKTLLMDNPSLTNLDLRGNGLDKRDANLLLTLLEQNDTLAKLNMIPVIVEEAQACKMLELDGTGISTPSADPLDDDDEEDPEDHAYADLCFGSNVVQMDEGDGFLFASLVTAQNFPDLRSIVIKRHDIPDVTLTYLCDALLALPSVETLQLSDLRLTNRGASLLLTAVTEMAPRQRNLNGLWLQRLVQLRHSPEAQGEGALELISPVEWNDFSMGAMSRLQLWPHTAWPSQQGPDAGGEFALHGLSLTDVGLRGVCSLYRHLLAADAPSVPRGVESRSVPRILRIDLTGNQQITDTTVAELCRTLQSPGGPLRQSLKQLSLRSCPKLKVRSAFELLQLLLNLRDSMRDHGPADTICGALQSINGVDVPTLQAATRTTGQGGRPTAPPMLLRSMAEVETKGGKLTADAKKPDHCAFSECDSHFYANVLHVFPQIPYCHVHIGIDKPKEKEGGTNELIVWGNAGSNAGNRDAAVASNASPFPAVEIDETDSVLQAHINAAVRLFEACPVSTRLQVSIAPVIPGCNHLLEEDDGAVLVAPASGDRKGLPPGVFGKIAEELHLKAAKTKRKPQRKAGSDGGSSARSGETPRKPLYVNNINSQRLHDCYRTLYGQDDVELLRDDIYNDLVSKDRVSLPACADISGIFAIASSVDLQHVHLRPGHLTTLSRVQDMPVLTHVNLNSNNLGNIGVEALFRALASAGANVVHVAVASNQVGNGGAYTIASTLLSLPRLTSLDLRHNYITETGSIALAEAIGGVAAGDEQAEEIAQVGPLQVLSVDLEGNGSRELAGMRWAEVIASHPTLQFLSLADNGIGRSNQDMFFALVYAATASTALCVLDLRNNFPVGIGPDKLPVFGAPPMETVKTLVADLPAGEYDPAEVKEGVFIRRHRGTAEKKGRQPQQGSSGTRQSMAVAPSPRP